MSWRNIFTPKYRNTRWNCNFSFRSLPSSFLYCSSPTQQSSSKIISHNGIGKNMVGTFLLKISTFKFHNSFKTVPDHSASIPHLVRGKVVRLKFDQSLNLKMLFAFLMAQQSFSSSYWTDLLLKSVVRSAAASRVFIRLDPCLPSPRVIELNYYRHVLLPLSSAKS